MFNLDVRIEVISRSVGRKIEFSALSKSDRKIAQKTSTQELPGAASRGGGGPLGDLNPLAIGDRKRKSIRVLHFVRKARWRIYIERERASN